MAATKVFLFLEYNLTIKYEASYLKQILDIEMNLKIMVKATVERSPKYICI